MRAAVGHVRSLWRFPVKSMLGERSGALQITSAGVAGDRAYALVDSSTGRVLSAKAPVVGAALFACRATLVPSEAGEPPQACITLGDGTSVTSDDADADGVLSRWFGREVRLATAAPDDFTIDQYHPDVEDADPQGRRDTVTASKQGAPLFAELGLPSPVPAGAFVDAFPVSLVTTSTLGRLAALGPGSVFDERRFRMNLVLGTAGDGFVENDWLGHEVEVGAEVRLAVELPDPRCVMVTLAQEELPRDMDVLRTLVRHNRLDVAGGRYPCAGVYAVVVAGGTVREGDPVRLV